MVEDVIAKDIREIKWHQEAIDSSMELLIKANSVQILEEIMNFFNRSKRRVAIYLAIDGKRSVSDIAQFLSMKGPNVSTELTKLKDEGLIEVKKITASGYYVYKKRKVDKVLKISKKLKQYFDL